MRDTVVWKSIFHCLSLVLLTASLVTISWSAELLPLPSPERGPQYQQSAPMYNQSRSSELMQFRREIQGFPCQELAALRNQLRSQFRTAKTEADRVYYRRFLDELYREMDDKHCSE